MTFMYSVGMFDVILPFLLIFVLSFAVLERTKILGTIKIGGEVYPKKNLDALAAFSLAFIVVGSAKLVSFIVSFAATMMVILVIISLLVILNASFYGYTENGDEFKFSDLHKKIMFWTILLSIVIVSFMLIPFQAFLQNPNVQLIRQSFSGMSFHVSSQTLADIGYSIFTFGFIIVALWLILRDQTPKPKKKED